MRAVVTTVALVLTFCGAAACFTSEAAAPAADDAATSTRGTVPARTSTAAVPPQTLAPSPACAPVLIALFRDRTGSAATTATPAVTPAHLDALLAIVQTCGGEIAYGEIIGRGQSFMPLTRVRFDQPQEAPARQRNADAFEQQRLDDVYRRQLAVYRRTHADREARVASLVEAFKAAVTPQLARPASARSSDVLGAVERALLYLQEPQVGWSTDPRRVIVLVSDARHNTGPWDLVLPDGLELLLVNGVGSQGAFEGSDARLFESLDSAIRWLAHPASAAASAVTTR